MYIEVNTFLENFIKKIFCFISFVYDMYITY